MSRIIKFIDKNLEQYLMGVFLISISTIMFIQVFMRLMGSSLAWAEELCRYMYVWSVFLSISLTIKKQTILRVDLFVSKLPPKLKKMTEIILQLITTSLFTFLTYYAVVAIQGVKSSLQTSPAMEIPMYLVYSIIPLGFLLTVLRSLQQIFTLIIGKTTT